MNKEQQLEFIKENYPKYTNHKSKRRIRHDFFKDIQTELQAYLLGFYAADGSINEKRKTLRIQLSTKDIEIVYLFKDVISPDARMFSVEPKYENVVRDKKIYGNGSTGVDITSAILVNDLVDLGIGYNKTYSDLKIPNIQEELIPHFIRGYFDGDGSIIGSYVKEDVKTNRKARIRRHFGILSKTDSILLDFKEYFESKGIKINMQYLKRDDMWKLTTSSKKEVEKIFKLLYSNSNFYLTRKFEKFDYYVNTEVSQIIADHRNAQEMNDKESNNSPKSVEHPTGMKICAELSDE